MSILIVGDSFSSYDANYTVWGQQIASRTGISIINRAVRGAGYIRVGDNPSPQRFSRQILRHPGVDVNDVQLVIVFGSCNDRSYIADNPERYPMLVFQTLREAKKEYPNALLLVVSPQWSGPNAKPAEIETMRADISEEMWGFDWDYAYVNPNPGTDYANWWFPPTRTDLWQVDKFHPNQAGHDRMADKIEPHVRTILGI